MQGAVEFPLPSQSRSEGNGVMDAETSLRKRVPKPRVSNSTRSQFKAGQLGLTQQKGSEIGRALTPTPLAEALDQRLLRSRWLPERNG